MSKKKAPAFPAFKQWDIVWVRIQPNDRDEHPAILFSPTEVINKLSRVCVIYGSTKRPSQDIEEGQILLNGADGLDHMTIFDTALIYMVRKDSITGIIGEVSHNRRTVLKRKIISVYRLL
jgi:hypothetical protein